MSTGLYALVTNVSQVYGSGNLLSASTQNARTILENIIKEVRYANSVEIVSSQDASGFVLVPQEEVKIVYVKETVGQTANTVVLKTLETDSALVQYQSKMMKYQLVFIAQNETLLAVKVQVYNIKGELVTSQETVVALQNPGAEIIAQTGAGGAIIIK